MYSGNISEPYMKKETSIAVFLGILFGVFVAIFMISKTKEKNLEKSKPITVGSKISPTVAIPTKQLQNFEILEPKENIIVNTKSITIRGKASKDALIVIHSPIKELAFKNVKEDFSVSFPLAFGENVIQAVVYPKEDQLRQQEKELRVYYLDEQ